MHRLILLIAIGAVITACNRRAHYTVTPRLNEDILEIPFDFEVDLLVIQASVNGVTGNFIFDNGFTLSAISPEFASESGIVFDKKSSVSDANNKRAAVAKTILPELWIDNAVFPETAVYEIDTKNFLPCDDIDGIIGANIINTLNWKIDFQDQKITFSNYKFNFPGVKIPLSYSKNNSAFLDISIKGNTTTCKLDMGKQNEITFRAKEVLPSFQGSEAYIKEGASTLSAHGLGSSSILYELVHPENILHNSKKLPAPAYIEIKDELKYGGYIGVGYLKRYQEVIFNGTEKELILGDTRTLADEEEVKTFGLGIYKIDGKWQIVFKYKGNNLLDEAPVGSVIEQLDNKPISRFQDICELKDHLKSNIERGRPLNIILNNGKRLVSPYGFPVISRIK